MSETDFGRGMRAPCPLHPDQVASRTCTRCGNFMCGTCSVDGTQPMCPACRERAGVGMAFPLDRSNWTVSALLDLCWAAFKREWVMISVGLILFFVASFAGQLVANILTAIGGATESTAVIVVLGIVGFLLSSAVQGVVLVGYMRMLLDVLDGQRADLGRMFSQFHKAIPYLTTLLLFFVIFVPLLFVVFGGALLTALATGLLSGLNLSREGLEAMSPEDFTRIFQTAGSALAVTLSVAMLLYLAVMVWVGVPLMLMQLELAGNDAPTAWGTVRRCFAYAKGERWSMVGVSLLGIPIFIVGALACCVGLIPAMGFFYLLLAGLYLSLRNGAQVED